MGFAKKIVIPVVLVIVSLVFVVVMVKTRQAPSQRPAQKGIPEVSVEQFLPSTTPFLLEGYGRVEPFRAVDLTPQVSGEVIYAAEKVELGTPFGKGELLFRIDPTDYRLALESVKNQLKSAEMKLMMEEEEQKIARSQWEEFSRDHPDADPGALTLRTPQVKQAAAARDGAEASLQKARIALRRTSIRAPFNGIAVKTMADPGQIVGNAPIARLYGTDRAKIVVQLAPDKAGWVIADSLDTVQVHLDRAGKTIVRQGILRSRIPVVDPNARTVSFVVELQDPLGTENGEEPLPFGSFTEVYFPAHGLTGYYSLPRAALLPGDSVRVFSDGKIHLRAVNVVYWKENRAIVTEGLSPEDSLVLTGPEMTVDGMRVKVADK
ncbi:MAG: efflux RND transporter periplasmic adaptor subunit [Fibrobacterota bacterium]